MTVVCVWDTSVPGVPDAWQITLPGGFVPRLGDHVASRAGSVAEVIFVVDLGGDVTVYLAPCSCWDPRGFTTEDHEAWFEEVD